MDTIKAPRSKQIAPIRGREREREREKRILSVRSEAMIIECGDNGLSEKACTYKYKYNNMDTGKQPDR